jgi:cysteine desulfurase/selenocysteine lyase
VTDTAWDVAAVRRDFPILNRSFHGRPLIYLDNAATTQKPVPVLQAVDRFYRESYANVHRGIYALSEIATDQYEAVRRKVAAFINAPDPRCIIFTRGATEAINLVAYAWGRRNLGPGDEILITEMEHHSNIVPWQMVARDTGATLNYIPITADGTLDLSETDRYFTPRTRLVSLTHQSNVFGTVNPVRELLALARQVGALTLVDAAQSVPHMPVDVQELDCDFLAFSGHKLLGPTGVGVLYGKLEILEAMEPFMGGGEMILTVSMEEATWNEVPHKFEAGTPNIAQVIGLGAALDYLSSIGMEQVHRYGQELLAYALDALGQVTGITIYGRAPQRGPVISFNLDGVHPHDLAQFLDQDGIAVRAGHHCAQPIMNRLNVSATARASFYLYNTREEIDQLCQSLEQTRTFFAGT